MALGCAGWLWVGLGCWIAWGVLVRSGPEWVAGWVVEFGSGLVELDAPGFAQSGTWTTWRQEFVLQPPAYVAYRVRGPIVFACARGGRAWLQGLPSHCVLRRSPDFCRGIMAPRVLSVPMQRQLRKMSKEIKSRNLSHPVLCSGSICNELAAYRQRHFATRA